MIDGDGIVVGINDFYFNKGMVYQVSLNLFFIQVEIYYGVFKCVWVGLVVFDLSGCQVVVLEDSEQFAGKYYVIW